MSDAEPAAGGDARALPSEDEVASLFPGFDLLTAIVDAVSEQAFGTALRPRVRVSPLGLLRGELDVVKLELPAFAVAGLVLDRFIVRGERVRIAPGFPPKLVAAPAHLTAVVSQENVDRWTRTARLPFRARLTPDGVVTTTGFGGIRMSEVTTELDVSGRFVRLRPQKASIVGVSAPLVRLFRGYLPLPPLPRDARLEAFEPGDGELVATFVIERFEQALTPALTNRLTRLLPRLPRLPGTGDA